MVEDTPIAHSMNIAAGNILIGESETASAEELQPDEECGLDMYGRLADSEDEVHQAAPVDKPATEIG